MVLARLKDRTEVARLSLLEAIPSTLILCAAEPSGPIRYVNASARALLADLDLPGWPEGSAVGQPITLFQPTCARLAELPTAATPQDLKVKAGSEVLRFRSQPIAWSDSLPAACLIAISRITDRVDMALAVQTSISDLSEVSDLLEQAALSLLTVAQETQDYVRAVARAADALVAKGAETSQEARALADALHQAGSLGAHTAQSSEGLLKLAQRVADSAAAMDGSVDPYLRGR